MRVHWTDTSQAYLDAIHAYIVQDSAALASLIVCYKEIPFLGFNPSK